jgi:hypothetical protein
LIVPFPESSLNEEAGKLFMENYEEYFKIAKIYTGVHTAKINKQINNNNDNVIMEMDIENIQNIQQSNILKEKEYNDNNMDLILTRHSKSVNFKSGIILQENMLNYSLLKTNRTDSFFNCNDNYNNENFLQERNYVGQKPGLSNLNLIRKNSGTISGSNQNNGMNLNLQTPKTKKDEIKKWLSRI